MPSRGIKELEEPLKAKFVCGLLFSKLKRMERAVAMLEDKFGSPDMTSLIYPFDFTDYYNYETGPGIKRLFVSFKRTVSQDSLAEAKLATRGIELALAAKRQRSVNIDPGIITAERLVLATSKNFTHRIYLGMGIYADLALVYRNRSFQALPWTFADYRLPEIIGFWNIVRSRYMRERQAAMNT